MVKSEEKVNHLLKIDGRRFFIDLEYGWVWINNLFESLYAENS